VAVSGLKAERSSCQDSKMGQCMGREMEVGDRTVVVKRKLGEGAFSDVVLAVDASSGAKYAMKVSQ
jgi:serine/threonine protein kinase